MQYQQCEVNVAKKEVRKEGRGTITDTRYEENICIHVYVYEHNYEIFDIHIQCYVHGYLAGFLRGKKGCAGYFSRVFGEG